MIGNWSWLRNVEVLVGDLCQVYPPVAEILSGASSFVELQKEGSNDRGEPALSITGRSSKR